MKKVQVRLEISGKFVTVGYLLCDNAGKAQFIYDDRYLQQPGAQPISINLPLRDEPSDYEKTKTYFEGLLPEGFTRRSVAQWLRVNEEDYISILCGLGAECLGAVQIVADGVEEENHYDKLSGQALRDLAREGALKSAELMMEAHLSLAGASGKTGLYYHQGDWYLPKGLAASTHIVKQSHVRLERIVANEQLCLLTAKKLGIDTVESSVVNLGRGAEGEVLFATKRYDRSLDETTQLIDGLPCPLRLHQEDFAQALGIGAKDKYEPLGAGYIAKMFSMLRKVSAKPLEDTLELWRRLIFNYLIGNNDGHIKNFALLYSSDLSQLRLAPAYDIISTTVYEQGSRNLSLAMGGESRLERITMENILQAAGEAGLGRQVARNILVKMQENFQAKLLDSAAELSQQGFGYVWGLAETILAIGGIAYLKGV